MLHGGIDHVILVQCVIYILQKNVCALPLHLSVSEAILKGLMLKILSHILEVQGYLLMAAITTLTVETSIMSKSIFHTIYQDKSGYTHDTEVILKF